MTWHSIRIARRVLRAAVALSPPEQREWSIAMEAEMYHVGEDNILSFALGCLWAMVRARVATQTTILNTTRWSLVLCAVAWSILHIRLAGQLSAFGATTASTIAYLGAAAIAGGAFLTAVKGLHAAVLLATPVIVMSGLVAAGIDHLLPTQEFARFYRAIATEYVFTLLIAVLIAIGVPAWVKQRERTTT